MHRLEDAGDWGLVAQALGDDTLQFVRNVALHFLAGLQQLRLPSQSFAGRGTVLSSLFFFALFFCSCSIGLASLLDLPRSVVDLFAWFDDVNLKRGLFEE